MCTKHEMKKCALKNFVEYDNDVWKTKQPTVSHKIVCNLASLQSQEILNRRARPVFVLEILKKV
jgi:hypothetical protein